MLYVIKLPSGIARVSTEEPLDSEYPYLAVTELPAGDGILRFDSEDNLYLEAYSSPAEEKEDPMSEVFDFMLGLMEEEE